MMVFIAEKFRLQAGSQELLTTRLTLEVKQDGSAPP